MYYFWTFCIRLYLYQIGAAAFFWVCLYFSSLQKKTVRLSLWLCEMSVYIEDGCNVNTTSFCTRVNPNQPVHMRPYILSVYPHHTTEKRLKSGK